VIIAITRQHRRRSPLRFENHHIPRPEVTRIEWSTLVRDWSDGFP
jgi:hypothetical protein